MHGRGAAEALFKRLPKVQSAPLVLDSPHSGTTYPEDFGHVAPVALLRKAEDTYVDELYADAPGLGVPLMGALFPRSYVDVNRGLSELDPALIDGDWPDPLEDSEKAGLGVGLIWRKCPPDIDLYDRRLSVEEARRRIDTCWHPYHAALKDLLDQTHRTFGAVWHINCHSMPEMSNALSKEGPGIRRPEFCLGDRRGTTCDPAFLDFARTTLEGFGYQVAVNEPYAGVELVRAYADPGANRHSLQVEIRRDLYMNEDTFERTADFPALRANLKTFVERLAAYTRDKAR